MNILPLLATLVSLIGEVHVDGSPERRCIYPFLPAPQLFYYQLTIPAEQECPQKIDIDGLAPKAEGNTEADKNA